ncbi:DNA-binding protein RFX2 isoform X2 [Pseudorca crassidens]|uniref:DNA-binding protein RFX2 isoform X2 n=1 Tax=Pseudorca crassidens TaxID=82174 RepID=UPI00352F3F47
MESSNPFPPSAAEVTRFLASDGNRVVQSGQRTGLKRSEKTINERPRLSRFQQGNSKELSMQNSEGGSDSPASVALCPSSAAQAPVAQPVPASPQRVLVQAAGSAPKGAQMQPISLPRVQQVPQQVQPVQHVYPPQVQYVEGGEAVYTNGALRTAYAYNPEPQMYAPSSSASYFEAPGGAQVTVAGSSPTAVPAHSMVGITMDVGGSPIVSGTGAYLIHGGMDGTRHSLAHTSRSSPATLQWLLDNYETAEGVSLPRSSLYNHYLRHCQEHKLDPVNAASFGKLIRSVFMGLRTRRLGTRGNSKYHYYGIRLKPDSPLNRLQEDTQYMAMRQQPVHQKPRYRPAQKTDSLGESGSHGSLHSTPEQAMAAQSQHHQQYIDVSHVFPEFPAPDLGSVLLQENVTLHDIKALQLAYRRHCEATLDVVMNLQFHYVEKLWLSFWNSKASSGDGPASLPTSDEEPEGAVLPKDKLVSLCKCDPVLRWMRTCDHILYQALVEILIPDVLRPVPSTLTQAIRNFAKSLEGWLTNAMSDFPQQVIQTKVGVVGAFAQTLRRYTSLNHLAQAARAVLQNTAQISQMLSDLNRVDFANVQEQASWVCQCEEGVVQRLEQDFKLTLQQQSSLDQWASWLDNVVTQVLKQHAGSPSFPKAARQFLLKWSFYSSMVIRDLTLRSAASFGSFHLIRLLYDEYMFYLVEHRVAEATGETPIAVMGEFNDLASLSLTLLDKGGCVWAFPPVLGLVAIRAAPGAGTLGSSPLGAQSRGPAPPTGLRLLLSLVPCTPGPSAQGHGQDWCRCWGWRGEGLLRPRPEGEQGRWARERPPPGPHTLPRGGGGAQPPRAMLPGAQPRHVGIGRGEEGLQVDWVNPGPG